MKTVEESVFDRWLRRSIRLGMAAFVVLLCVLMVQLSLLALQARGLMNNVAEDIKTIGDHTLAATEQLQVLTARAEELSHKAAVAGGAQNLERLVDELVKVQQSDQPRPTRHHSEEIEFLLNRIGESENAFRYSRWTRSATTFELKLRMKFKLYRNSISTTEEFIEKVATRSMNGKKYYVVKTPSGEEIELADWLNRELRLLRSAFASAETGKPTTE